MNLIFYSSLPVFILNNLNISTIKIGAKHKPTNSKIFSFGKIGILNAVLNPGINNTISINAADNKIAPINFALSNIPVLNIDFLLFLTLNTCTSSENASVINV